LDGICPTPRAKLAGIMGYQIEIEDLRSCIKYAPDYPYPWDGTGTEPEDSPETGVAATDDTDCTESNSPLCHR
jgi:hypothetical protein